jgi:tetratricopeptide (TPR) repeat protein
VAGAAAAFLTRGALARMYAHGELYPQAIAELRAALTEDPERPDLQILLAEMYWRTNQRAEAAEVASAVLATLPNCREANRIMAAALHAQGRTEEALTYHRRVAALTPSARSRPSRGCRQRRRQCRPHREAGLAAGPARRPRHWAGGMGSKQEELSARWRRTDMARSLVLRRRCAATAAAVVAVVRASPAARRPPSTQPKATCQAEVKPRPS